MFKFEKLEVWKKSVGLYQKVSKVTDSINQREQFSLGEQLYPYRAISLKAQEDFFNVAKGSIYEVVSLL